MLRGKKQTKKRKSEIFKKSKEAVPSHPIKNKQSPLLYIKPIDRRNYTICNVSPWPLHIRANITKEKRLRVKEGAEKGKSVVRKRRKIDLFLTANQFNNSVNGETR